MKVLIIGANGFLGRNVVNKYIEKKYSVTAIYNQKKEFIPSEVNIIQINKLFSLKDDYDVIFLLAAHIPYGALDKTNHEELKSNIELPLQIISHFWPFLCRRRNSYSYKILLAGITYPDYFGIALKNINKGDSFGVW